MSERIRFHPRLSVAVAVLSGAFAMPALAQYAGKSAEPATPKVSDILSKPVDEQMVRLQGHLVRKTKSETYVFSDGSGEIVVEIDDDDFPKQKVDETTKVEIVGEVDTGLRRPPEIEAETVRVLP